MATLRERLRASPLRFVACWDNRLRRIDAFVCIVFKQASRSDLLMSGINNQVSHSRLRRGFGDAFQGSDYRLGGRIAEGRVACGGNHLAASCVNRAGARRPERT